MTNVFAKNEATSAEEAAKIVPRAEFRVFGQGRHRAVKAAHVERQDRAVPGAAGCPPRPTSCRRNTNEANVKVRDGLLDIKTKIGETPEGYEIFQPRGKFQFPVKRADLATILSHLKVEMALDRGQLHDRRVHRDGAHAPGAASR